VKRQPAERRVTPMRVAGRLILRALEVSSSNSPWSLGVVLVTYRARGRGRGAGECRSGGWVRVMPTASQRPLDRRRRPTRSPTSPVQVLSLTMIIMTSASRKVIGSRASGAGRCPESFCPWYLASMVTFWSSASLPSWTGLERGQQDRGSCCVLAGGHRHVAQAIGRCPLARSFRYQLVWNGSVSQRASRRPASSFMALRSQSRHVKAARPSSAASAARCSAVSATRAGAPWPRSRRRRSGR